MRSITANNVHMRVQRAVGFAEDARSDSARAQPGSGAGCQAPRSDSRGRGERSEGVHPPYVSSEMLRRPVPQGFLYYNQKATPASPAVLSRKKEANAYGDRDLLL